MDLPNLWWYVGAGTGVLAAVRGFQALLRTLARRRRHRHLQQAGRTVVARVATVEPMQRSVNGAAGHPVSLTFEDGAGGPRAFRDTSGLGGYLVREGAEAVVRYSPTDPELVRVEELVGRHGRYPVRPDGRFPAPSLVRPLVTVLAGAALAGGFGLLASGRLEQPREVPAAAIGVMFASVGALLLVAAVVMVIRRARQRLRGEAAGVVTEVWTEQDRTVTYRHGPRILHPFTVHFATEDGREVHARNQVASSGFRPQPYQRVRVRYDRAHPVRFEVRELRGANALLLVVLLGMGLVFLLVGTVVALAFSATGS